ncbi:hypothetical protein D915_009937 [Fasciola hepatica]|uniref:Uncharacterized protein n=1 Tax=Fasciola hepatica TaxID=6192 RepID=A0A4E0QWM9_FASHE|nr:hypothetical protein D915_009937 [Fasciola hepatica]
MKKEVTKSGLIASTNPILLPFGFGDRDQERWSAKKIPSGNPGILFRPTKYSLCVNDHESLIETKKLALFTNFHKSYSFPGITPEREVFAEKQQACINIFVTQSVHQCALYSADLLYRRMENSVEIDHSEKNTLCRPAALPIMGNFSGTLSHIVTTIPITQVTDVPEAASSSLVGHSTSACSLLLSDDNDHPLIFSRPEKVDDHSANSNNNNYKNAIPAGIVGRHDGVNFEKFDSQDSNTSSSALPSVESQSKPVLWKNEESLNVTVQLDKLTDYLKRDEANEPNANGKTEVTNVSRDGNREPKEQQSHYKGIQAVPEDSSQSKIQLVLGEMISSLDYEPCSNGDESDDSDAYIRRRLIEINAKFAQEPLPSDKGQVRETKVAFKKQLIDLVAPSPDFSRTEPADVRLEWSGAWEKVADSCDSVLSEDFSQPIVHESSPHLENVQVNIPAVKILNAVRPIQSVNAEELTAIKQEANMGEEFQP